MTALAVGPRHDRGRSIARYSRRSIAGPPGHPAQLSRLVARPGVGDRAGRRAGGRLAGDAAALGVHRHRQPQDHRRPVGRGHVLAAGGAPAGAAVLRRAGGARGRRPDPAAHRPRRRATTTTWPGCTSPPGCRTWRAPAGSPCRPGRCCSPATARARSSRRRSSPSFPRDVLGDVALLTLACPARRLYGRAFPAYFGGDQLAALRDLLDADPGRTGRAGRAVEEPAPPQRLHRLLGLHRTRAVPGPGLPERTRSTSHAGTR